MQFPLSHLSHCLSIHHPPPFTTQYKPCSFPCPICSTVFQFTTHHLSLPNTNHAVSLVPSVPLSFSSPPTTFYYPVQTMQFLLSHLSHCLSVYHPPPFTNQYKRCRFYTMRSGINPHIQVVWIRDSGTFVSVMPVGSDSLGRGVGDGQLTLPARVCLNQLCFSFPEWEERVLFVPC
jgi:hypothetical protein